MTTSAPEQSNKVDVTFVVRNNRHAFFDEDKGYTTTTFEKKLSKV